MSDLYSRQKTACPHSKIAGLDILVVGAGATGRAVSRQVALLGPKSITIVDHDSIENHNRVPQMWPRDSIGKAKVEVLGQELADLCDDTKIICYHDRWIPRDHDREFHTVFPCVDNIEVRGDLFEFYFDKCEAFMDIRIGGDNFMVLNSIGSISEKQWYKETLFEKKEAAGEACAQPMTNYIANIASGVSVSSFARFISGRGFTPSKIIEGFTLSDEFSVMNDVKIIKKYFK